MAKNEKAKSGYWSVIDTNARVGKRRHQPLPGVYYELSASEPTHMPAAHAAAFLSSKSFIVYDEQGNPQNALPKSQVNQAGKVSPSAMLEPGQVIANVDELEKNALLTRAVRKSGGEKFTNRTKKETLVEFLVGRSKQEKQQSAKEEAEDDLEVELEDEDGDVADSDSDGGSDEDPDFSNS